MKLSVINYILFLLIIVFSACHKVEDDLSAQYDQPSVTLTGITLPDGTYLSYPKDARAGDTLTITGRLNLSKGATVRLGKQDAVIVEQGSFQLNYPATGGSYLMEKARFVVTPGMGSGPQPLIVTCGAYHVQAPDINIITQGTGGSQPDTTLVVTQLFDGHGTEAFMARYKEYGSIYIDVAVGMSNDGTVYFASKQDIYRIRNNSFEWVLKKEDGITLDGTNYPIAEITGMAPDPNNQVLYYSGYSEMFEPGFRRIYWLIKKDLSTQVVSIVNKTVLELDEWGLPISIQPSGNTYGRVPVDQMPVFASQLKVDIKGRLLLHNYNPFNYMQEIDFYCRVDPAAGNLVTPLYETRQSLAGVFKCANHMAYTNDGLAAYVAHEQNGNWPFSTGITVMDLETLEPGESVDARVNITYASFDPNPQRRMKVNSAYVYFDVNGITAGDLLPLSKKELLFVNSYSIASLNPETAYLYAYAGMEPGCAPAGSSSAVLLPEQHKMTGPAKYVNYYNGPDAGGRVRFLGKDASGAVYFLRGGEYMAIYTDILRRYYIPPTVYKLAKP
nr:hypothetical protein [uncultured Chitinophaga sp.]